LEKIRRARGRTEKKKRGRAKKGDKKRKLKE